MIFSKLFGPRKSRVATRDVEALTEGLTQPAIQMVKTDVPSASYVGGGLKVIPGSPSSGNHARRALSLLAHIDLSDLHTALAVDWLPACGALEFYYDIEKQPWGFDPKDRGGWAVILIPGGQTVEPRSPAAARSLPPIVLRHSSVAFRRIKSYPSWERESIASLQLSEAENEVLCDLADRQFQDAPQHQIAGFPSPVQGDCMELECELVSHGIYCGSGNWAKDPRAVELAKSASDWRLLMQFDSDEDLGAMWGDAGKLYFFVREQDARAGKFENAWLVLQCG